MPYKYIVLQPDGSRSCETHNVAFSYNRVKELCGDIIQECPYFSSLEHEGVKYTRGIAWANENGHMHGLQPNWQAREAWLKACPKGDPARMHLVGPIVFIAKEKPSGEAS